MSSIDSPRSDPLKEGRSLNALVDAVAGHPSVRDKLSIHEAYKEPLGSTVEYVHPFVPETAGTVQIGDDCAALPDGHGGHQLFAAEGLLPSFVQERPWFAGYSSIMVNLSDICAMGGLPTAVTNMLWVRDRTDGEAIWAGMRAAAEAYDVPIVGGHTSYRCEQRGLGVAVLGQAHSLLTSYDARPGEALLMAVDLNGRYVQNYPFWNASTEAAPHRLQSTQRLMQEVAENGWSRAAKDISMGGVVGTLGMLLQTSQVGATLQLGEIPKPAGVDWEKWLVSFPSYGFLLTALPDCVPSIKALFQDQEVACEVVGEIQSDDGLWMVEGNKRARVF
jgi:AIR synthase-related protein